MMRLIGKVCMLGYGCCFIVFALLSARTSWQRASFRLGQLNGSNMLCTGAVIAVVGLYDKGKTFVLNQITQSSLPSGKRVSTKGLSFKVFLFILFESNSISVVCLPHSNMLRRMLCDSQHVNVESTNFVLLDSAGSYSPVKVTSELSVAEKEVNAKHEVFGIVLFCLGALILIELTQNTNSQLPSRQLSCSCSISSLICPTILFVWSTILPLWIKDI